MLKQVMTFILLFAIVYGIGYWHGKLSVSVVVTPHKDMTHAESIRQVDGSIVLERAPDTTVRPKQTLSSLPIGTVAERVMQVTVAPQKSTTHTLDDGTEVELAPGNITVDLTLARLPDGSSRIIASSPDGVIIKGIDIPIDIKGVKTFKHVAGISYDWKFDSGYKPTGAWYQYQIKQRIVVGGNVRHTMPPNVSRKYWSGDLLIGWRF